MNSAPKNAPLAIVALVIISFFLTSCGEKSSKESEYKMIYVDPLDIKIDGYRLINPALNRNQADYYIENLLGWQLIYKKTYSEVVNEIKTLPRTALYINAHGVSSNGSDFIGVNLSGGLLKGSSLTPVFNTYRFAFLNCCWSGLEPEATNFHTALTKGSKIPTTYMGWGDQVNTEGSAIFGSLFFDACDNSTPVGVAEASATMTLIASYPGYANGGGWPVRPLPSILFKGSNTLSIDCKP
jgi:hypothetical protein